MIYHIHRTVTSTVASSLPNSFSAIILYRPESLRPVSDRVILVLYGTFTICTFPSDNTYIYWKMMIKILFYLVICITSQSVL